MLKGLFRRKVRDKNLVEGIFRKSLLVYILSDIAYASGPLVDGIVTGNFLGVDAVAAVSLVSPSIFIFNFALCILSAGAQSTFTELLGQGKVDESNSVFTLANVLGVISSLTITLLILTFSHPIVRLLGAGAGTSLERYSADYLCGWSLGLAFSYCAQIMNGFMNIDNDSSMSIFAITAMTLTNIAGDLYVVLFTDTGIYGLALATSLSNVVYFAVLSLHFLRKNRIIRLNFRIAKNFLANFLNICRQGSMSAFSRVSKSLVGITINHIIISSAASYALAV